MLLSPFRPLPARRPAAPEAPDAAGDSPYSGPLRYAPGLDGLRALAVAGVVMYHAGVAWAPGGFLGVDLFFVLSGYLITSLLLAEYRGHGRIDLRAFWAGRARRLLPAATLVVAVCVLIGAIFPIGNFGQLRVDALSSLLYVNNWHQILASRSYFAAFGRPSLLQHYWSLSVEEQFYLVWPLLLMVGLRRVRSQWIVLVAGAVAIGSALLMAALYHAGGDPSRVYYGTDTRLAPLMIGAMAAFVWPFMRLTATPGPSAARLIDGVGVAGLAVVVYAMASWHDYDPFLYQGGFALAAAAAVAAVGAAAHPASRLGAGLGARPLRWLGQRSYGIYLWHWPVMALSRPGIDIRASRGILVPAQVLVTLGLAELSYRYVEMPVRRRVAERRLRAWLAERRPRVRLAAVSGAAGAFAAVLVTIALLPAGGSALPARLRALESATAPPIPAPARVPERAGGHRSGGAQATGRPGAGGRGAPVSAAPLRGEVLAVGASVMLAAKPELEKRLGARVDAIVGRQPSAIIARLAAYRRAGALPARVVVQIGDNGPLWHADVVRLRQVLAGVPEVVLVNIREPTSWEQEVNDELEQAVRGWPQASVADWRDASADPSLLYDGAHPDPAGALVYANVVARALARGR